MRPEHFVQGRLWEEARRHTDVHDLMLSTGLARRHKGQIVDQMDRLWVKNFISILSRMLLAKP
jgi:hypothetical protein